MVKILAGVFGLGVQVCNMHWCWCMCLDGTVSGWWWWARYDAAPSPYDGASGTGGGPAYGSRGAAPSPETLASAGEPDSGHF